MAISTDQLIEIAFSFGAIGGASFTHEGWTLFPPTAADGRELPPIGPYPTPHIRHYLEERTQEILQTFLGDVSGFGDLV